MKFRRARFLAKILTSTPDVLIAYTPLLIVLTAISVAIPFVSGQLINALAYRQSPYLAFLFLAALRLLQTILTPRLQQWICSRSRKLETDLQYKVLDATMNLSPSRLSETDNGSIVAKLTRDTYAIGCFVRETYPRILQATVIMISAGLALFSRSTVLAISFVVFFPMAVLLFSPFAKRFADNSHRVRKQSDISFNSLFEFVQILPLLKAFDAERRFADAPKKALGELKESNHQTDALSVRFGWLLGTLLGLGEIAVLGIASALAIKGKIPVGDVVLYQMLFITSLQSIQGVVSLIPGLAAIREGVDSLLEAFELQPHQSGTIRIETVERLCFEHVSFAYRNSPGLQVIRNFSAVFSSGSVIGLTGTNGAGKSTLLKLAVNALEPQEGKISINGHAFSEIDNNAFRHRIDIVCQDNPLIPGTIRDNITLRDPSFSDEAIASSLVLSGFDDIVKRLPNGLDTVIGNSVRNLSGGERQRLAIARAMIRNPMILILDEATNHLDAKSRENLTNIIPKLSVGRLVFIAGHDPELNKICDMKISCQIF